MSKNGLYLSEENKGGYGNPNGLYLTEQSTSSNNGAVRIGGSLYSKNWDNSYKGMHVPNGHGSLFNAMDQDARIIAQCEANKLLWIAEANKQKALENGANLNAPIVPPPPVLNQSQPNQPIGNNQPMTELEKALAEIKALKEANAAKELEIANMFSREEVEELITENRENIQKMGEELTEIRQDNAEKDGVIAEQNKDIEHSHQINELKTKEIHELRQDKVELHKENNEVHKENNELHSELKHADYKLKTIIEHNKALSEQVKDHKDLAQEWKIIVKEKNESLQKTIEELTIEKAKVSELTQKIGVHNHDGSSSWIQLEQEEIPNLGEGALENQNSD